MSLNQTGLFVNTIHGGSGVPLYWLGSYHKYWLDRANRTKNERFDAFSRFILNLKDPQDRGHQRAVDHFSRLLTDALRSVNMRLEVELVRVPSSKAGVRSPGLDAVIRAACKELDGFTFRPNALRRVKTVEKLANGGDRSVDVHMNSIEYEPSGSRSPIFVIDDVTTTGNSLIACSSIIFAADYEMPHLSAPIFSPVGQGRVLRTLALGKTADD